MASIRKSSFMVPSADIYIGYEPRCTPYWPHSIMWFFISILPESFINNLRLGMCIKIRKKGLAKDTKKKSFWCFTYLLNACCDRQFYSSRALFASEPSHTTQSWRPLASARPTMRSFNLLFYWPIALFLFFYSHAVDIFQRRKTLTLYSCANKDSKKSFVQINMWYGDFRFSFHHHWNFVNQLGRTNWHHFFSFFSFI